MKDQPQKLSVPATGKVDTSPEAIAQIHGLAAQWQALVVADLAIRGDVSASRRSRYADADNAISMLTVDSRG